MNHDRLNPSPDDAMTVAAALVGIFLSTSRLLTAFALVVGVVIWITGIYLTPEE